MEPNVDDDSIDGHLSASFGRSPQIDFQAKCHGVPSVGTEAIPYDLSVKNYDDLRKESMNPRLLLLALVPADEGDWMNVDHNQILSKHSVYWLSLRGEPSTENDATKRVHLPRENLFTPGVLMDMLQRVDRTGAI